MTERPTERHTEPLLFLVGPTAVGKSELALELAAALGADILALDSMQVYRRMDIGTAKPSPAERARIPHACLDLVEPSEVYDVSRYLEDAFSAIAAAHARGRRALFVGGTGLYLRALVRGLFAGPRTDPSVRSSLRARAVGEGSVALHAELALRDPASAARIHPHDERRVVRALEVLEQTGRPLSEWQQEWGWHAPAGPPRAVRIVGLKLPAEQLAQRIRQRVARMLALGWIAEARAIRDSCGFGRSAIQALGYREVLEVADGKLSLAECEERVVRLTRRFVRRQRTWFRSFADIVWLDPREPGAVATAREVLEGT